MDVGSVNGGNNSTQLSELDGTGFASLDAEAFMKLFLTELQNQDPLEPFSNEDMLNQLSLMRNMQSSVELGETLKSLAQNQQLTTAASLIGQTVTALPSGGVEITGVVERATTRGGETLLSIGEQEFTVSQIISMNGA